MNTKTFQRELDMRGVSYSRSGHAVEFLIECPECRTPHLYFNPEKGVGWCHKCSDSFHFDSLGKYFGIDFSTVESPTSVNALERNCNSLKRRTPPTPKDAPLSQLINVELPVESVPAIHAPIAMRYLIWRGITYEQINQFGIRYCYEGFWRDRVIIPVYASDGRTLLSFVARSIVDIDPVDREDVPKYRYPKGSKTSKTLFGFNKYRMNAKRSVFIVEGVFDFFAVEKFAPCMATFGKHITHDQIELLSSQSLIEKIYLMWDGDVTESEFKKASSRLRENFEVRVIWLPKGKDPGECVTSADALKRLVDSSGAL